MSALSSYSLFEVGVASVANGVFAVSAIASMMTLAGEGRARREGLRMGLWGAAQAIAMGSGVFLGALAVDVAAKVLREPAAAYAVVFGLEGFLFLVAAGLGLTFASSESGVAPQQSSGCRGMMVIQGLGGR